MKVLCFVPKRSLISPEDITDLLGCSIDYQEYPTNFCKPYLINVVDVIEHKMKDILKTQKLLNAPNSQIIIFDYGLAVNKLGEAPGSTINDFYDGMTPELFEKELENEEAVLTFGIGYYDGQQTHYWSNNFDVVIKNLTHTTLSSWLETLIPPEQTTMLNLNFVSLEKKELYKYHSVLFQFQKVFLQNINCFRRLFIKPKITSEIIRAKVPVTYCLNVNSVYEDKRLHQSLSKFKNFNDFDNFDDEIDLFLGE